jgi:hypothetical protein
MRLDLVTRRFWCASYFVKRSPDRNPQLAIKVLEQVASRATGTLQDRAVNLLMEIEDNGERSRNKG